MSDEYPPRATCVMSLWGGQLHILILIYIVNLIYIFYIFTLLSYHNRLN